MSWASRRRTFITLIIVSVGAVIAAGALIATFYKTPSCTDNTKNQGEEGIDCGGPCSRVCSAQTKDPVVDFTRFIQTGKRVDVIAYIETHNPSFEAARAPYTIQIFDTKNAILTQKTGTIDLPAMTLVPVYIPNVYSGPETISRVFLTLATSSIFWNTVSGTPNLPQVGEVVAPSDLQHPQVTATLTNTAINPIRNMRVVATLFDASDNVMAASQTVVDELLGGQSQDITFTWSAPFTQKPARIEVLPVAPLFND